MLLLLNLGDLVCSSSGIGFGSMPKDSYIDP